MTLYTTYLDTVSEFWLIFFNLLSSLINRSCLVFGTTHFNKILINFTVLSHVCQPLCICCPNPGRLRFPYLPQNCWLCHKITRLLVLTSWNIKLVKHTKICSCKSSSSFKQWSVEEHWWRKVQVNSELIRETKLGAKGRPWNKLMNKGS